MKYRFDISIVEAVRIRGLTINRLAQLAHVSPSTVSAAVHGQELQIATALRIARAVSQAPVVDELERWSRGGPGD